MSSSGKKHTTKQSTEPKMDTPPTEIMVPENFMKIIRDFVSDLSATFPEYVFFWEKWSSPELTEPEIIHLFEYVLAVFPERFFDILYQNDNIFNPATADPTINTCFLPNVDFKILFNCRGISDTTKKALWKYLQLILFCILNSVENKTRFGDSMGLFDGMDENILQEKLKDTMSGMMDFFSNLGSGGATASASAYANEDNGCDNSNLPSGSTTEGEPNRTEFNFNDANIPNPEDLHEHLKGLFDGKIGKLAKELAEEISGDLKDFLGDEETGELRSSQDVMKTLLKNPKKMMDLVKTVGKKINKKMEDGEISQEEMMKEATEMFSKMKGMGGEGGADMGNMAEMMQNFAKMMGGNGAKVDMNATEQRLKQNTAREKLRKRLQNKKTTTADETSSQNNPPSKASMPSFDDIEKIMSEFGLSSSAEPKNTSTPPSGKKNKNKKR